MKNQKKFGQELKKLRDATELSQTQFVNKLLKLIHTHRDTLEKIGAETKLKPDGDIRFGVTDLSKYENGWVEPERPRILLFIFLFRQYEKIGLNEANALLKLLEYSPLDKELERPILFGEQQEKTVTTSTEVKPSSEALPEQPYVEKSERAEGQSQSLAATDDRANDGATDQTGGSDPPPALPNAQWIERFRALLQTHRRIAIWSGSILTVMLLPLVFWFSRQEPPAVIFDDFKDRTRCKMSWDFSASHYAVCQEDLGHLAFDVPVNTGKDWRGDVVDSTLTGKFYISRLNFTVELDKPSSQAPLGDIGVQLQCSGESSWLTVYVGESGHLLFAEYGVDNSDDSSRIEFSPVTLGEEHNIDLAWVEGGIQVKLDGRVQDKKIPCVRSRQLNLNAGGIQGTQVKGYITNVRAWD